MKNAVFWNVTPCVALVRTDVSEELSVSIRVTRIGELGTTLAVTSNYVFLRSVRRLLVTGSVVPSSPILVTLMVEALRSSETSVLTRVTHGVTFQKTQFFTHLYVMVALENRHSPAGTGTTYEWQDRGFRFQVPVKGVIFSLRCCPGSSSLLSNEYWEFFRR
jgi:hypothetical protein